MTEKNNSFNPQTRWDRYFMEIANVVARNSKCISRQLGAVLVRDRYIIATSYNGPSRRVTHCGPLCPRRAAGFASGEGLHLCPAAHAEVNCIATCARLGIVTADTTLYLNWVMPCKNCAATIINAGIKEVVHSVEGTYDSLAQRLFSEGGVEVRRLSCN